MGLSKDGAIGLVVASLLAACLAPTAFAAPPIDPSASSDALLHLRPGRQPELRFTYRKEQDGKQEVLSVGLSSDYHYVKGNGAQVIHDYKLRRVIATGSDQSFVNDSLFAEVWFRVMEVQNRAFLAKALEAGKIDKAAAPTIASPFWIESELGIVNPQLPRPSIKQMDEGARSRWLENGEEVLSLRYRPEPAPEPLRQGLRRMWPTILHVHPEIADTLAGSGRLPEDFSIVVPTAGKVVRQHWILVDVALIPNAPYPLSGGLNARPTSTAGAFPEIFSTLSKAVAERRKPLSEEAYATRMQDAIGRGAGLEAALWATESLLASGSPNQSCSPDSPRAYCRMAPKIGPLAKADPRTAIAFGRNAPSAADRLKFNDLPNAYLLGVLFATRPQPKDVSLAVNEQGLLNGLKAAAIANFCKDASDFYLQNWAPTAAWQAADMGRLMANHRADDLLSGVDRSEEDLLRLAPMHF